MSEVIQAIFIRETQIRSTPKPHVVYKVEVHAAVRNWVVWKRYSEFFKLDSQFQSIFPKLTTPSRLPPKRYFPSTFSDPEKIEERKRGLEDYLRNILSSRDDRWRSTDTWKEFLSIPTGRALDTSTFYTLESWLDEYNQMSGVVREIRSLLNKKTTHMSRNEISASHNCTVQAKKLLMNLSSKLSNLEAGLNGAYISEGELRRRQDMLNNLKDEKDLLLKLASSSGGLNTSGGGYSASSTASSTTKEQRDNKKALLGGGDNDNSGFYGATSDYGFYPQQQQQQQQPVMKEKATIGRAFGAAALKRQKEQLAKETEVTRGLDNEGLLLYQQQIMGDQDDQVQQFEAILARQKQLGISIGHELETQNQILDELDADVGRTQTKLKYANKKLQKIK